MPKTNALLERRERQARRLLRVCLRPLETGCLQGYVDGYEAGTLQVGDSRVCALAHMGGCRVKRDRRSDPTDAYFAMEDGPHGRQAARIEAVYEGWELFYARRHQLGRELAYSVSRGSWEEHHDDPTRARWIYEACLEELARRASIRTPALELATR